MRALRARRAALIAVAAVACVLPLGGAQAAGGDLNAATAIVEQDDGRVFDLAWDVSRERGDEPVRHRNSATARASCLRCRATAIAFQVVLVTGSPQTVAPVNTAEALNLECTGCVAAAEARQFVRVVPQHVRFTNAGRTTLNDVRADLAALEGQDLPPDQLHAAVEAQEARVRDVLNEQLVLRADPAEDAVATEREFLQDADLG